jgi:hypothetical protein
MKYEARLLLTAIAALVVVGAVNYAVDPFGISLAGYDSRPLGRDSFDDNVRLAKAHIVSKLRPEAVILGTSRAEIGISPAHPAWRYRHVYNLGLPHASLRESGAYLEHAIAAGRLKQAVFGLDFLQFNPALKPRPDFEECRIRDPGSSWARVRSAACDIPALFLSRSATAYSIGLMSRKPQESIYLRDGSRSAEAKEAFLRQSGSQHAAFLRSELEFFENIELVRGFIESEAPFEEVAGPEFEALLRTAHRHEVDLRLFFSPTHARHDALLFDMGLIDDYIRWKRFVVETMERVAAEYGDAPYKVWDFSDATGITTEELPALDDADSRMHWHWESSHYTRALGDLILRHVLGNHDSAAGRRLTSEILDEWIAAVHRRHAAYREAARSELELMRAYVRSPAKREQVNRMLQRQNWK